MLIEFFADMGDERDKTRHQLRELGGSGDPATRDALEQRLRTLNEILDEDSRAGAGITDATVERWEEMLDRGEAPEDLFEIDPKVLEKLKRAKR